MLAGSQATSYVPFLEDAHGSCPDLKETRGQADARAAVELPALLRGPPIQDPAPLPMLLWAHCYLFSVVWLFLLEVAGS